MTVNAGFLCVEACFRQGRTRHGGKGMETAMSGSDDLPRVIDHTRLPSRRISSSTTS